MTEEAFRCIVQTVRLTQAFVEVQNKSAALLIRLISISIHLLFLKPTPGPVRRSMLPELAQAMGDMYSAERFPRLVRALPSEGHKVVDFACGEHHAARRARSVGGFGRLIGGFQRKTIGWWWKCWRSFKR